MDRILVVVFENERTANEGVKALEELDLHGSITVYRHAVVVKRPDGAVTVGLCDDRGPSGLMLGIALGGFLGALGGPVGLAIGGSAGFVAGAAADLMNARLGEDFVDDVAKALFGEQGGRRGEHGRVLDSRCGHPDGGNRRHRVPSGSLRG